MAVDAVQDANQNFSPVFARGTLGTADVKGTSGVVAGAADPATGAQYVYNLGPAGSVSIGDIQGGTIDQITTGSIVVTAGTVVTTMGDLSGGTIDEITNGSIRVTAGTVSQAGAWNVTGTIANGSIAVTAGTIGAGTLNTLGTVSNILAGTIQNSGTTTGVGTISNIAVVHNAGTLAGGTIAGAGVVTTVSNLTAGSIAVTAGTITNLLKAEDALHSTGDSGVMMLGVRNDDGLTSFTGANGDYSPIGVDEFGNINTNIVGGALTSIGQINTINDPVVVSNGTIRVTAGTVNSGTINAGTINSGTINAGTINSGTINAGTVTTQPYPASQVQPAYAVGTAAAGTLVAAAGAGTGIYVNSIALTAMSGTLDMCLSFALGSTTNQVVQRGLYAPGQGVALGFPNPSFYGTANAALTYQILSGAGTASWAVTYNTKGTP